MKTVAGIIVTVALSLCFVNAVIPEAALTAKYLSSFIIGMSVGFLIY